MLIMSNYYLKKIYILIITKNILLKFISNWVVKLLKPSMAYVMVVVLLLLPLQRPLTNGF